MTNSQPPAAQIAAAIVAVPTLNEADHIETVIATLRGAADRPFEIWVIDGGSDDGTREIVEKVARTDQGVRLLANPQRTQAAAINHAAERAKAAGARYLIRADAHAYYPEGWVALLIATAEEEGADSVVVPMTTRGGGAMRDASADVFNSWLGNGGSPHRTGRTRGFVEHGHHALFRLDAFLEAGGYDPRFLANEDAELDVRLRKNGRRIFLENRAAIEYLPRNTLRGVMRQFARNGRYRLCTSLKHGRRLGARQLAPIALVAGLAASAIGGALLHPMLLAPLAIYVAAVLVAAAVVSSAKTPGRIARVAAVAIAAHLSFGFGALRAFAAYLGARTIPFASAPQARTSP